MTDSVDDDEFLAIFRTEAAERVDAFAQGLDALAQRPSLGEGRQLVQHCFRTAHNLKGAARLAGVTAIEDVAHAAEDLLAVLRDAEALPDDDALRALERALVVIDRLSRGERGLEAEIDEVVAGLRALGPVAATRQPQESEARAPGSTPVADTGDEAAEPDAKDGLEPREGGASQASVRVTVARLDAVMSRVGELITVRSRLQGEHDELQAALRRAKDVVRKESIGEVTAVTSALGSLETSLAHARRGLRELAQLSDELNSAVKRVRMLPLATHAPMWRQVVRETAQALDKPVRLHVEVGDLELDKHVLDEIRDPVMHLLRNAIDHGIEPVGERERRGKAAQGNVWIRARMVDSLARLEVRDDGRGLDLARIGQRAVERGLLDAAQLDGASPQRLAELLFQPGFSTAADVSRLSGRGVGLDVVRQRAEELGGAADIVVEASADGLCVRLTLPVSLASLSVLEARAGQHIYAFPVESVERTVRVSAEQVEVMAGQVIARADDGEPLVIRRLAQLMGQRASVEGNSFTVVVVRRGGSRLGLAVDELMSEERIIAKRLPWNLRSVSGVSSAFVGGDGSVILIVNVPELFDMEPGEQAAPRAAAERTEVRTPRLLVVDDSVTSRTLQKNIFVAAGYEVVTATNGQEGWDLLQHEAIDLVLADVEMPVMTGIELTRRIRASQRFKELPVVIITSLGSEADIQAGADAGADEYVVKGRFNQRELLEAVARLV